MCGLLNGIRKEKMMDSIGDLLKKIRGKDSMRIAAKKTGLSFGYISILEKGVDPRSGAPIKPSPDTLRAYSNGYMYPYDQLMQACGYSSNEESEKSILKKEQLDENERRIIDIYSKLPAHKRKLMDDLVDVLAKDSE